LVVSLVIPLVTFASLALYAAMGGVLHQISIAALVLSLGLLVDNAIVIAERIQWRVDRGETASEAAVAAVKELFWPLLSATGTTMAAFVPFQIIMVPMILLTGWINVYGTYLGIAIVHAVVSLPIMTLIFRNFYKDIPRELVSAALMDSGSFWRIFGEIILPMSGNIMVVVLIMKITNVWNDFLIGLTFGGVGTKPMTVVLANVVISTTGEATYNEDMAAALLTAIPPLLIYFVLGRFFVQGITAGAIKG